METRVGFLMKPIASVIVQYATMVIVEATGRRRAASKDKDDGEVSKRLSKKGKEMKDIISVKPPETSIRKGVEISRLLNFVAKTFDRAPQAAQ